MTWCTDLGFQGPTPLGASGSLNDVTTAGKDVDVNADRSNRLYEF